MQIPAKLRKYDLEINHTKTERYEILRPNPPPPPDPSIETLIKHKDDKIIWSELDWISNYQPVIENKEPNWRDCKLLGSKLDTKADISKRKGLTMDSMKTMKDVYDSRRISCKVKLQTFNAFSASIFLYNAELWTLTRTLENKILPSKNA